MKEKQIIKLRKKLEKNFLKRKNIHFKLQDQTTNAWYKLKQAEKKMYDLTRKCTHRFSEKGERKYMGKGKCEICGYDDY